MTTFAGLVLACQKLCFVGQLCLSNFRFRDNLSAIVGRMLPDIMQCLQCRTVSARAVHVQKVAHIRRLHRRSCQVIAAMSAEAACKYEAKPPFNFGVTTGGS